MIKPVGNNNGLGADSEYKRLMQEMHYFGLSPSGNKNLDAQKLSKAKAELVKKIQNNNNEVSNSETGLGVQVIRPVDENENVQRSEMEEQRLGAMNVAQLNRIYFGL